MSGGRCLRLFRFCSAEYNPIFITMAAILENNSTTTVLDASATFTGTTTDVSGWSSVSVSVFSEEAGTLILQESSNGTNWDLSSSLSITGGIAASYSRVLESKYYRTRYTNGGDDQTVFRLQTKLHHTNPHISIASGSGLATEATFYPH